MSFKSFEDMEAWQEARELMRKVRVFSHRAQAKRDWVWAEQISRAALSVMANIAEGNDASTNAEFVKFLGYAKRSDAEVRSHLYHGFDEGYMNAEEFEDVCSRTKRIGGQLATLMHYLAHHLRGRRTNKPATS